MPNPLWFFRLYRADVALITFLSASAGYYLSGSLFSVHSFIRSLFISLVLYNFVYVINSIADYKEDSLNKPHRPIPSGNLSLFQAKVWAFLLFVVSVAGSLLLFSGIKAMLALLVTLTAIFYSLPPFSLKKYPLTASFVTAWGLGHPLFVTSNPTRVEATLAVIFAAFAATIFKDVSDVAGDRFAGRHIITDRVGMNGLATISVMSSGIATVFFVHADFLYAAIVPFALASTVIVVFRCFPRNKEQYIYKMLIRSGAFSAIMAFLLIIATLAMQA